MSDPDNGRVTLRDHFAEQIKWVDRYFEKQLENTRISVDKAEMQLNKRLEGMNEFRDTLKDQASRLATKDDAIALDKRIQTLERAQSTGEGKTSIITVLWSIGVSVAIALVFRLWK